MNDKVEDAANYIKLITSILTMVSLLIPKNLKRFFLFALFIFCVNANWFGIGTIYDYVKREITKEVVTYEYYKNNVWRN
jgi:hypothetical protein